jgi:cholesterol oxidase
VDFDAIVIGSGFGGAVSACRLAEAGYRVLVLERGRRWDRSNYPRKDTDPWWWSNEAPEKRNGWLDLRVFRHMAVAQGAAVGGGSLIYANISAVPKRTTFAVGWPPQISWESMAPHYETVGRVMNVKPVPEGQWPRRTHMMREAAKAIGEGKRFEQLDLAVSFSPDWHYGLPENERFTDKHSQRFVNAQGVEQGTCVHLGNCDIGCDVDARNTLDRNYLALAETDGAEIRALHLATAVEPVPGGYKVSYYRLEGGRRKTGSANARVVVVAAGSLGSTELMLRCRDVLRTLSNISERLGHDWSSNGDFLTPAFYLHHELQPSQGPTITSAINFVDTSQAGETFWIQDGGFPNIVANWLTAAKAPDRRVEAFLQVIAAALRQYGPLTNVMPWFAQGVDRGGGKLYLRRDWARMGARVLDLEWDIDKSRHVIETIVAMHKRLSRATGGKAVVPPSWDLDSYLITPHPLGGCNMGTSRENGVVDHRGEVFGHRNLFVMDGAIVPRALGINPSRTIAALAEHATRDLVAEGR